MSTVRTPLILLSHNWPGTSARFVGGDGPVECWTDAELCRAVLFCIEGHALHECPSDMIKWTFQTVCVEIQNEWELRSYKRPAWMLAQLEWARQERPGLAQRYVRLKQAEEGKEQPAPAPKPYPKYIVGWRIRHDKFGVGTVVKQEGNKLHVDFDSGLHRRVVRSFVTQIYGDRPAHVPTSAELRAELNAYSFNPQPDPPNHAA